MPGAPLQTKLRRFAQLSDEDIELLDRLASDVRSIAARREIVAEEDPPRYLHMIVEGWAARYKTLPNASRQITSFLVPGDFCDLDVAISRQARATVRSLSPCKVAWVGLQEFNNLIAKRVDITSALWRATVVDEAAAREWIVNLGRRDAQRRIAHFICDVHSRLCGTPSVESQAIFWPISQTDLADAAGLTPVHVNRVISKLRERGLIELTRRSLRINDLEALREVAWFAPRL